MKNVESEVLEFFHCFFKKYKCVEKCSLVLMC